MAFAVEKLLVQQNSVDFADAIDRARRKRADAGRLDRGP
jgi:hypothetical protein